MIELGRHIEILLLDHDCVTVPGFGGFTAHHVSAHYDADDGVFLPPMRTLGFNARLGVNDSLLALSYVEAYDLSYPEALRRIEAEVRELRATLDTEGRFALSGIGTLRKVESHVEFEPCEAGLLSPALYGLSSYELTLRTEKAEGRGEKAKSQGQKAKSQAAGDPAAAPAPEQALTNPSRPERPEHTAATAESPAPDTADYEDDEPLLHRLYRSNVLRGAVAACIIMFAFLFIPTRTGHGTRTASMAGTDIVMEFLPKAAEAVAPSKPEANPNQPEKHPSKPETAQESANGGKDTAAPSYWCVVVASQIPEAGAKEYAAALQAQGYKDAHVYAKRKCNRVVMGRYGTEKEAREQMKALNNKDAFKDAWVMEVSND